MAVEMPTPDEYARAYAEEMTAQQRQAPQPKASTKQRAEVQPQPKPRAVPPSIAFLSPAALERWFVRLVVLGLLVLVLYSVFGTFYGIRNTPAPLRNPMQMIGDAWGLPSVFGAAVLVQLVLTLAQYGSRIRARHEPRWWLFYLVVLAVSVYYNAQAYMTPIAEFGIHPLIAFGIILAADILPEFLAVKH